jgi:hypothetical protein
MNRLLFYFLKKKRCFTDIENVGFIVPLPNHYISDMPQGAWAGGFTGLFLFLFPSGLWQSPAVNCGGIESLVD